MDMVRFRAKGIYFADSGITNLPVLQMVVLSTFLFTDGGITDLSVLPTPQFYVLFFITFFPTHFFVPFFDTFYCVHFFLFLSYIFMCFF